MLQPRTNEMESNSSVSARHWIATHMQEPTRSSFVVVGAHTFGVGPESANDAPFYTRLAARYAWGGALLIEANPPIASKLETRIRETRRPFRLTDPRRVIVSNIGVCPNAWRPGEDEKTFFAVGARQHDKRVPPFADQIGSFDRSQVVKGLPFLKHAMLRLRHRLFNWSVTTFNESIVEYPVPCHSLRSELQRRSLPGVAVLLVDAEGFDCDIVAELDLCAVRPQLITYEHQHCSFGARTAAQENVARRCADDTRTRYSAPARSGPNTHFYLCGGDVEPPPGCSSTVS